MGRRCGFVAIVGRPNVGKSTLLNRILGHKISITSRKPQTTRYQILGIDTADDTQLIFLDTPGWQRRPKSAINRLMNRQVKQALVDVDIAVQVTDARGWHNDDDLVYAMLTEAGVPTILAMNKHDLLESKSDLLPQIARISKGKSFEALIPVCARNGNGLIDLRRSIVEHVPERDYVFADDQLTDRPERFLAGEIIREKSMNYLGDELPYHTTVIVDEFREYDEITHIHATVWVDRNSQKAIVIGKDGALMKRISTDARHDLERFLGRKVFLKIWVKTKRGWMDNPEALQMIGMTDS
jgi:GTPase